MISITINYTSNSGERTSVVGMFWELDFLIIRISPELNRLSENSSDLSWLSNVNSPVFCLHKIWLNFFILRIGNENSGIVNGRWSFRFTYFFSSQCSLKSESLWQRALANFNLLLSILSFFCLKRFDGLGSGVGGRQRWDKQI